MLALPPLGTVHASTHLSPLDVRLGVDAVDFERLAPLATTPQGRFELRDQIERDLGSLLIKTGIVQAVGALLASVLLCAALFGRRLISIASGLVGSVVTIAALTAISLITYDTRAFDQPRFTGTLTRASEVVATLQRSQDILDEARSRFEIASRRVSDLITLLASEDIDPRFRETVILHISDIHANPIAIEITEELAREFSVDAVLDTGDFASSVLDTGEISSLTTPFDRELIRSIESLETPYFFVPGNHDSPLLLGQLARAENVTVFDDAVEDVAGLEVLGWADPTHSTRLVPEEEKEAMRLEAAEDDVLPAVEEAEPDVLAVHDERLAASSLGLVPLVLAGHTHERGFEEVGGTLLVTVGSTGATGLKSLTVEADRTYEAEILYFDGDELVAVDYIRLQGIDGDFELERQTLTAPDEE